jgi:5-methylcytosine-specific restriction endonuclease McrA
MCFVLPISNTNRFVVLLFLKTDPHLMYKVEKFVKGEHQCESCGFDPVVSYPDLHTKGQSSMLDVDHINSDIKHTPEGEQPSNYQLLCKHCHIVKSHLEGDYIAKKYR